MILELKDVLVQRKGVCLVLLQDHSLGGKPSNGGAHNISLFESFVKLGYKIQVSPQGYGSNGIDSIFMEASYPSESRLFCHV